jgi:hypothetical protein
MNTFIYLLLKNLFKQCGSSINFHDLLQKKKINFHDLDYLSYIQRLSIYDTGIAALEIDPNWQLHPILTRTTSEHTRHHTARNNITHPNSPSLSFSQLSRRSTHQSTIITTHTSL